MDNTLINIQSEGRKNFERAMQIAASRWNTTVGFRIYENKMVLYWTKSDKTILLPYEMNIEKITEFAWGWLEATKPTAKEPDHDGDNDKGFHLFTESWGQVFGEYQAYVAIEPIWAMYGK